MPEPKRELFRPSQAPDVIGVSRDTIYRWARDGKIHLHDLFGIKFVDMAEIRKNMKPLGDQLGDRSEKC